MVDLIRNMHDEGKVVKILTARVAPRANAEYKNREKCAPPDYVATADFSGLSAGVKTWIENMYLGLNAWGPREFVIDWCLRNLGFLPEITHEKDHLMLELYDDRVKQVVPNEGLLIEDLYRECDYMLKRVNSDNGWLLVKLNSKFNGFLAGLWMWALSAMLVFAGVKAYNMWVSQKKEPARIRFEAAHKVLCDLVNDWPECSQSIRTSEWEAK